MKRYIRIILGILVIVLGIIGLFLPILQGIVLIIVGVLIVENKPIKKIKFFSKIRIPFFTPKKR